VFLDFVVPLTKHLGVLNVFRYITFRTACALVVALLVAFLLGPRVIQYLHRINAGQSIREEGPGTHLQKSGTPTMGGVLILVTLSLSLIFFGNLKNPYVVIMFIATLQYGLIGFIDDYLKVVRKDTRGLAARFKLLMQLVTSASVIAALVINPIGNPALTKLYVPFFADFALDLGWAYYPFAVVLLMGSSNAVNLTDGLDGLATGLSIFAGMGFAAVVYLSGQSNLSGYLKIPFIPGAAELAVFGGALVGAGIGFLWYNAHPAELFMGDTGSLAIGGALGIFALMLKKELMLLIIGGVFVAEAFSVIVQVLVYKWKKKRVFRMAPIHHHFELKGWHENKVIIRFWIIGALLVIISLATLKVR